MRRFEIWGLLIFWSGIEMDGMFGGMRGVFSAFLRGWEGGLMGF